MPRRAAGQHLQAVDVGQHDVEHDRVGLELAREREAPLPVGGGLTSQPS